MTRTRIFDFLEERTIGVIGYGKQGRAQAPNLLEGIRSGAFAWEWEKEQEAGLPLFNEIREKSNKHPIAEWERKTREAFRLETI